MPNMTVSDFIKKLQELVAEGKGDLPIVVENQSDYRTVIESDIAKTFMSDVEAVSITTWA